MKFILLLLLASQFTFAADLPRLRKVFQDNYNTLYTPRACGKNIDKLVKLADANKIDLTNSYYVVLNNPGFWMLQAFSARGLKYGDRQSWSFHVILVADNYVFDFDFNNRPTVVPFNTYIKEMFVPKAKVDIPYDFKQDLPYFEFDFYDVRDYLKAQGSTRNLPHKTYMLRDLLDLSRL